MSQVKQPLVRDLARIAGWAALLAPLGILLHELGHLVAALALGFDDAALRVASVSGGARLGTAPAWMVAVQALAGPAVTLVLVGAAWRRMPAIWAIALAVTAPLRFLVGGTYLVFQFLAWWRGEQPGTPNFDEYNAAVALGLPLAPLVLAEVALLILVFVKAWWNLSSGRRLYMALGLAAGAACGLYLWMEHVGPLMVYLAGQV